MSGHTKGPWVAKELGGSFDEPVYVVLWPDKSKGGVHMRRLDDHGELTEANARLIAAAPELLEACEKALRWMQSPPSFAAAEMILAEAITKAKGADQ